MTGWLVISGRRGHYEFCDTTRAYNLADGAAFIHDSCSALVLKPGGHVDRDATNKGRVEHLKAGTIPVDNLREAVWMLLLRGEAEEVQLRAEYYPLPAGLTPSVTVGAGGHEVVVSGMWSNTAQTQLTWWWRPDDGPAFVGELTWPDSYQAAESHAASLLAIAEEAFADSCVAGPLPRVTSRGVRNLNEVPADAIRDLNRAFQRASERWKTLTACRSGAR
jgi:hypothetical protein